MSEAASLLNLILPLSRRIACCAKGDVAKAIIVTIDPNEPMKLHIVSIPLNARNTLTLRSK